MLKFVFLGFFSKSNTAVSDSKGSPMSPGTSLSSLAAAAAAAGGLS